MESKDEQNALLNSLNCELIFNDLRDNERRQRKAEYSCATAVCCGAVKSGWARSPLQNWQVESKDWVSDTGLKMLKSNILSSSRKFDKDLGVPVYDLTNSRTLAHLTKPHIFCRDLRTYQIPLEEFTTDTSCNLEKLLSDAWPCRLLTPRSLWQVSDAADSEVRLVLDAGPQLTRYLVLQARPEVGCDIFAVPNPLLQVVETLRFDGKSGKIARALPHPHDHHGLLLKAEEWLTPLDFLCQHSILQVPCGFITSFLIMLGVRPGKTTHREQVRMLLEHARYDATFIAEVLAQLPERQKREKKTGEDCFATQGHFSGARHEAHRFLS